MVASYDCSEHGLDSYVSHRVIQAYEYGRFLEALGRDSSSLTVGVGDFNMQPGSIPYRLLLRPGTTIRSAWDGWDEPDTFNHPNNSNAKGKKAPQKIDHIFYINHGNSKVTQRGVVFNQRILYRDISLSDHFGLWTQFEFDPTEPTQMTTSNPTYDSALVADAQSLINAHILDIVFEKKVFYSLVSFFAVLEIAFLLTLLFGGFFSPTLRKEKAIVLCTLFSTALLVATWGFGTCFRAYGFANDELAAHKQFLIEFGTVAKTK